MTNREREKAVEVINDAYEAWVNKGKWTVGTHALNALEAAGLCVIERGSVPDWMDDTRWFFCPASTLTGAVSNGPPHWGGACDECMPLYVIDGDA